ncbi:flippase [Hymenobacter sp. GOD-10R]|uniref:flippase n=1 Tax=Hymenobacter sp. GOD-10R TaxID=3093922 RepID=UPI002D78DBFA|nr:flippase [Hymenobacter sp. GOD-10R]WRQ26480.1 flippase [Hymenobacter sp. GOD-10R]
MIQNTTVVEEDGTVPAATPAPAPPRMRRFAINVASLFSVQIANFLLPLLTVPYVVRIIGPANLGLLNFSQAYVTYFSLLINYGFDMAAVRSIAANRDDKEATSKIFSQVMAGKTLLWVLSTIIFTVVSLSNPEFRQHLFLHVCTYLVCIGTVLSPFWLYQAMEDLGRVAIFNLAVKLIFSLSVLLLIRHAEDYFYQNLAISVSQIAVSVTALYVAMRRFGIRFTWPTRPELLNRFKEDRTIFFSSVMITIYASSNVFFLGLLAPAYNVGIYSAGTRLEGMAETFVGLALNQAFFPIVANAFGQGREQGLRMVRNTFFPLFILMSVVCLGLWVVAPLFIELLYGAKFLGSISVLRIVCVLPLIIGMSNLLGMHTMLNLRMDKAFFMVTAIGSVIGVALNMLLIKKFAHLGAAYALVITELYITLAMYIYLRYKGIEVVKLSHLREAFFFTKTRIQTLLHR